MEKALCVLPYRACIVNCGKYHEDEPDWMRGVMVPHGTVGHLRERLLNQLATPGDAKQTIVYEEGNNLCAMYWHDEGVTLVAFEKPKNGHITEVPKNIVDGADIMIEAINLALVNGPTRIYRVDGKYISKSV